MRHWKWKGHVQACLILLFSPKVCLELSEIVNPTDQRIPKGPYLAVTLNRSWSLFFGGNNLMRFRQCMCQTESDISCKISIQHSQNLTRFFNKQTFNAKVEMNTDPDRPIQTNGVLQDKSRLFTCVPCSISDGYAFSCGRGMNLSEDCARSCPSTDKFHHTVRFCDQCITLCWGNYNVTYRKSPDIEFIAPIAGSCRSNEVNIPLPSRPSLMSTKKRTTIPTIIRTVITTASTTPIKLDQKEADFETSEDGGQNDPALAVGIGLGCAGIVVITLIGVLVFCQRKRQREKQEEKERTVSYIQPYGDYWEEEKDCVRNKDTMSPAPVGSCYDTTRLSSDYQPYASLENAYSVIKDRDLKSERELDNVNKRTSDYELANTYSTVSTEDRDSTVKDTNEEDGGIAGADNPYFELSDESTDSGIAVPEYSLGKVERMEVEEKQQNPSGIVYAKLNGESGEKDCFKRCDIQTRAGGILQNHVYNKLDGGTGTEDRNIGEELETYNVASGQNPCNKKLNGGERLNESGQENEQGTYNMAISRVRDSHVYISLDDKEKIPNSSDHNEEGGEVKTQENHVYNRLNAKPETQNPDLETYNKAVGDFENKQNHVYNRLNDKPEEPDLGTYNMAAGTRESGPNNVYNKLNCETNLSDLETYNVAAGELMKMSRELYGNTGNRMTNVSIETRDTYSLATTIRDGLENVEDTKPNNESCESVNNGEDGQNTRSIAPSTST